MASRNVSIYTNWQDILRILIIKLYQVLSYTFLVIPLQIKKSCNKRAWYAHTVNVEIITSLLWEKFKIETIYVSGYICTQTRMYIYIYI